MLYVVIVNWNGWQDSIQCIKSLINTSQRPMTIIVSDNQSTDCSVVKITEWADGQFGSTSTTRPALHPRVNSIYEWFRGESAGLPELRLILTENSDNLGFAGGNNVGISLALSDQSCTHIFILNNDTEVCAGAVEALCLKAEKCPDIAVLGSTLVFFDSPDIVQGLGATYNRFRGRSNAIYANRKLSEIPEEVEVEQTIDYVIGAAMFVRANFLRRISGLCEDYFLYYEELDLSKQLLPTEKLGWARASVIRHKVGGSIGTGTSTKRPSDMSIYYDHRSKILFYKKYWPHFIPFLFLSLIKSLVAYFVRGEFTAVRSILWALSDSVKKRRRRFN